VLSIEDYHVPLESRPPQVKLMNDKGIFLEISYDKYIEIFSRVL